MKYEIHTDLAIEASAVENLEISGHMSGIKSESYRENYVTVTKVEILNKKGEAAVGKPKGNYITLEVPDLRTNLSEAFDETERILTKELKNILSLHSCRTIMVVGLGNRFVTPDALGPKVVDKLLVTRHLYGVLPEDVTEKMNSLCAVSPGVLGITGIETSEIISAVTESIKPDLIIAIDALASKKTSRISTTFQVSDTGIVPGSGIGNKRKGLTKETLGVPVIAIGVPTVIDAVAVANDAIELLIEAIKMNVKRDTPVFNALSVFDNENRYDLISEVLSPSAGELIVTPKEVDSIIDEVSKIIAGSINEAVNGEMAKKLGEIL